jgi:hypothetical protein
MLVLLHSFHLLALLLPLLQPQIGLARLSDFGSLPQVPDAPREFFVYNLSYAYTLSTNAGFEEIQLVAALQGILNRQAPRLMVKIEDVDEKWLQFAQQPEQWLYGSSYNSSFNDVVSLVAAFASEINGAVIYDTAVCVQNRSRPPLTKILTPFADSAHQVWP